MFPDRRLVAAIVDRVTFNAHILDTGTQSYRLRTSKTTAHPKASELTVVGLDQLDGHLEDLIRDRPRTQVDHGRLTAAEISSPLDHIARDQHRDRVFGVRLENPDRVKDRGLIDQALCLAVSIGEHNLTDSWLRLVVDPADRHATHHHEQSLAGVETKFVTTAGARSLDETHAGGATGPMEPLVKRNTR